MTKKVFFLLLVGTFYSCQAKQKFDKAKWAEVGDLMTFPNRKYMIDDLVKNYNLIGKNYNEIVELLDQPQSKLNSTMEIVYDIDIDYKSDIDPVYIETLTLLFDKDTVVKNFKVNVWKK